MNIFKKFLFLSLAGISASIAALFAFVVQLPSGFDGYTIRAPFNGGILEKVNGGIVDEGFGFDRDTYYSSLLVLRIIAITALVIALVCVGLHFRTQIVNMWNKIMKLWSSQTSKPSQVRCQYCAEVIQAQAIICRYCGKELA